MELRFTHKGWEDYQYWLQTDRQILNRINELIKESMHNPYEGIGKPEKLKGDMTGLYSRRITQEHRLVYGIVGERVVVVQCRYHYSK